MTTLTVTEARKKLYRLIDETALTHEPITITGKRGNTILISESDWRAIQKTMFLVNIPGMRDSIIKGLKTPIDDYSEDLVTYCLYKTCPKRCKKVSLFRP